MGTGEVVHILSFVALPGLVPEFEGIVQDLARSVYAFTAGITDVRVCHPVVGQVVFVITFLSKTDQRPLSKARSGR